MGIASISIENFKSIRKLDDLQLSSINILIGSNGVGKSNFISFFKFLNKIYEQQIQLYINTNGRADDFLYFGSKVSKYLRGAIVFDNDFKNEYEFKMIPEQNASLIFEDEYSTLIKKNSNKKEPKHINSGGNFESSIFKDDGYRNEYLIKYLSKLKIFHFHDTGFFSSIKKPCNTTDYAFLHEDGGNIAAFLYKLQESNPKNFNLIVQVIKSIAPFFDRFYLQPDEINPNQIYLRWYEKGADHPFTAHNFSDGTLRMICLATLLLQPNLPSTIIIDEPELGLHPFAISKLAGLINYASEYCQIIIATQSVNLVNEFSADDIIVVDRENNQSVFKRQSETLLKSWLQEYSIGELWEKNVIGGRL